MAIRSKDTRPHIIVVEDEQFQRETLVSHDFQSRPYQLFSHNMSWYDTENGFSRMN